MKPPSVFTLFTLLAVMAALAGCGNKGPLTLPPPPAKLADHTAAAPK